MKISRQYVVVEKLEEEVKEGFQAVEVQDSFTCRGKVIHGATDSEQFYSEVGPIAIGDKVLFAKYSPDTHEVDLEGKKVKFVRIEDILAIL